MAVKPEEAIAYLGYTTEQLAEFENIDALKEDADKRFINAENALKDNGFFKTPVGKMFAGKMFGGLQTKLQSTAKTYGIELTGEDMKDATPEKLFDLSLSKLTTASNSAQEELKKQIGAPPDAQVKEWKEKYDKVILSNQDKDKMIEQLSSDFTAHKEKSASEIRGAKLNFDRNQELKKVEPLYKPNINEVEKMGFQAAINSAAKFDYDEKGELIITDLEGHRIPSKTTHGQFQKPQEFLKELGLKLGVIPVNPHAKEMPRKPFTPPPAKESQTEERPIRKINTFTPQVNIR